MSHNLFIYGTLRDADVLHSVLGREVATDDLNAAEAPFFCVWKVAHVAYPCLLGGNDQDVAEGMVLSNLSDEDIAVLDRFEGANYQRQDIEVICDKALMKTEAYFPLIELETDGLWHFEKWQASGKNAFLNQDFNLDGVRPPDNG